MPALSPSLRGCAAALLLTLVAACGGGDGDGTTGTGTTTTGGTSTTSAATSVDVYVGRWTTCLREQTGSQRENLDITRVSDTRANFTFSGQRFASTDCSGTAQSSDSGSGTVTLVGKGSVGGEVVDKADVVENGQTDKDIFAVRADGKLYVGRHADDGGAVDAQGYPTSFDTDPFSKAS